MPGRLDQQPAGMAVAGLGARVLAATAATGLLAGHQAQPGPEGGPGEALPVTDLHRQPEPGQHPDPTQAAQPGDHWRPGWGRRQLTDGAIQAVAACLDGQHRPIGLINGDPQARLVHLPPDAGQPAPCASAPPPDNPVRSALEARLLLVRLHMGTLAVRLTVDQRAPQRIALLG